jgi:ATP phosphoribosyltransferase regulatory subunit
MFVTEGSQGERLALRPDFTIPVCLMHLAENAGPARYAYEGLVFRRHDQGFPERPETGYEDIGRDDRAAADADALALAAACAAEVIDRPLTIRLGDIGLFDALLRTLGLPGRWRRRLRRCCGLPEQMQANLEKMATPRELEDVRLDATLRVLTQDQNGLVALLEQRRTEHGFAEAVGRAPEEIAERFFDRRAIPDVAVAARAAEILTHYVKLSSALGSATAELENFAQAHGLDLGGAIAGFALRAETIARRIGAAEVRFEAGFGRPLDYYTGLVFEIHAAGVPAPLVGGGRYDRMMEMLGAAGRIPAVGFTMRLDLASEKDAA